MKKRITDRRRSNFFLGLSGVNWIVSDDIIWKLVENLMSFSPHKSPYYKTRIKRMNKLLNM